MISAIILASGFSRRLKTDKLLVKIGGVPLIERVVREVRASRIEEVLLVYREESVAKAVEGYDLRALKNDNAHLGMSESLKLGVRSADVAAAGYLFFVGDQVFLDQEIINRIIEEAEAHPEDVVIPLCHGERTNPVYFPGKYKQELLQITGDEGGRQIIKRLDSGMRFLEIDSERFCQDLDMEEDFKKIEEKLGDEPI